MYYFVLKRHGARWDSLRLFAGPFGEISKAHASYVHLPEQQQQQIVVVQQIDPNTPPAGENTRQPDLTAGTYANVRGVKR